MITRHLLCWVLFTVVAGVLPVHADQPSRCYGTTSGGSLENGRKLPRKGSNFDAYSFTGHMAGRTYVHSTVHRVVLDAYRALESAMPDKVFVYGDTPERPLRRLHGSGRQ